VPAAGSAAVGVALAATPGGMPGPGGYQLLERAARLAGKLGLPLVTLVDTPGADPGPGAEASGIAATIGNAMAAVLRCPTPTVAVIVGEGGSGGALAAACADTVLMAPDSYVAALSPEGTAATMRVPVDQAANGASLRPTDLRRLGFADEVLPGGAPREIVEAVVAALTALALSDAADRMGRRNAKWSTGLHGCL
jgi:acetyl-CoA carboxylase carboxyl transferase subunit beta